MLPLARLAALSGRFRELEELLCQPDVLADSKRYTLLSRERGELAALVRAFGEYTDTARRLDEDRAALEDAELRELVAGTVAGRTDREQITLFKSVGLALEDLAAATLVCGA